MERNPDSRLGMAGWAAIGAFVVAFDRLSPESLTHAFARGREHESRLIRAATVGAAVVTFAHLMDWIDHRVDPFYLFIDKTGGGNEGTVDGG